MDVNQSLEEQIWSALAGVNDPEINRPITELGMVHDVQISDDGVVSLTVLLTVPGCPMRDTINNDVTAALLQVPGVKDVQLTMSAMNDQQRTALTNQLRGDQPEAVIPFAQPGNLTRVIAVASGKGGVGKSSVTVNLALALAKLGHSVGLLDADIYGHSVPDLLGLEDQQPTVVDGMIMPVPVRYEFADGPVAEIRVISMGMLKQSRDQVIAWRGPILDRALTQFLSDVYWGDLDYFLIDLPPGTGDVPMSIGQKLPGSEILVVTTPQGSVAEVSERAGSMAAMMNQQVLGVVENMSWFETTCPHCDQTHQIQLFGSGGGEMVADELSERQGRDIPLLGQIPMDELVALGGERGLPIVVAAPERPAAQSLTQIADKITATRESLIGQPLHLGVN